MVGLLEAFTDVVGEAINALSGFRFTRLTANVAKGATTFPVETTFGWESSGKCVIGGVVYSYSGTTPTALQNVSHVEGVDVVVGAKADLTVTTPVIDFSRAFSAIDLTVRQFFVDTATGADLSMVGRTVGVDRPPGLEDDEAYRKVIKALAYAPKGTLFTIEAALTAFFGAGNFEVWENFPTSRNTVFIRILGALFLATSSVGQAYLTVTETQPLDTGSLDVVLDGTPMTVSGVRLAPERLEQDCTARLTTLSEVRYPGDAGAAVWTYDPSGSEVLNTSVVSGRLVVEQNTNAGYFRPSRILPESTADLEVILRPQVLVAPTPPFEGYAYNVALCDGAREFAVRVADTGSGLDCTVQFIGSTGAIGGKGSTLKDVDVSIIIRKRAGFVQLLVNGVIVATEATSAFAASTQHGVRLYYTKDDSNGVDDVMLRSVSLSVDTTTDFWNRRGSAATVVDADTVDLAETFDGLVTDGKVLRLYGGAVAKNNDAWVIVGNPSPGSGVFSVSGTPERQLAFVETAFPTRVRVAGNDRAFKYPDDIGKLVDLTEAQTAPNPGSYAITQILDPVTLLPYSGSSVEYSGVCVVSGAAFVTETQIPWRLAPAFAATTMSWELCGMGAVSGNTLTLPEAIVFASAMPVGYVVVVEAVYSQVLSAQLLAGREIANSDDGLGNFAYYPFYLPSNPLGPFASFLDDLTVAGVIPEIVF